MNRLAYVNLYVFYVDTLTYGAFKIYEAAYLMLAQWEREYPGRRENIFRSMRNVARSQLAVYRQFDFLRLSIEPDADLYVPAPRAVNR